MLATVGKRHVVGGGQIAFADSRRALERGNVHLGGVADIDDRKAVASAAPESRWLSSPVTMMIEMLASLSSAGPMMAPGWMVVSSMPLARAKSHAACSALVLPMQ